MARVYQVPRHAFIWLVAGALLASLPHMWRGPLWLALTVPVLLGWRMLIQRGVLAMPGKLIRFPLLLAVIVATLYSHGTVLGPEAGVTLLVAAFALKMLEMFRLRDAYVAIILACFVLATAFLFARDPLTTLYIGVVLVVVVAALVGINDPESGVSPWRHLRQSGVMVLQALPLMMVFFVLVPRLPPLWNLQVDQQQAKTGMSDSMSPGEVSRLSRQSGIAFRVEFDGKVPPPAERYWRGLTYGWFDGRRWSQAIPPEVRPEDYLRFANDPSPDWYEQLLAGRGEPRWRYRVVMERTGQQWLYALSVPFSDRQDVALTRDLRLLRRTDLETTFDYRVDSYQMPVAAEGLPEWERRFYTTLPPAGNSRARQMATEWRASATGDGAFITRLLLWFNQEQFYYTLEPPLLGENTVDDFLFRTRRGFCEHYASSFAFMLRAAGIPARIVAGYQGGELNPLGDHLLVRQYDAHVWVEAWLAGQGWVEFDPTAAVAPARIEWGLDAALAESGESATAGLAGALRGIPILARLGFLADYIEFGWAKWVLGYNQQNQLDFLSRWLGKATPERMVMALAAVGGSIMLVMLLWMLWRVRRPGLLWWQREHRQMTRLLRRRGVPLAAHMTSAQIVQATIRYYPGARQPMQDWQRCYEAIAYRREVADPAQLRRQLRMLRRLVGRRLLRRGVDRAAESG
jgi:protein-glutamine gamma-glutamyltransferase